MRARQTKVKDKVQCVNIYHVTAHGLTADHGLGRVGTSTCTLHTLAPATTERCLQRVEVRSAALCLLQGP